jgi:hypothetical protein
MRVGDVVVVPGLQGRTRNDRSVRRTGHRRRVMPRHILLDIERRTVHTRDSDSNVTPVVGYQLEARPGAMLLSRQRRLFRNGGSDDTHDYVSPLHGFSRGLLRLVDQERIPQ